MVNIMLTFMLNLVLLAPSLYLPGPWREEYV
jgi:hypothetical protein